MSPEEVEEKARVLAAYRDGAPFEEFRRIVERVRNLHREPDVRDLLPAQQEVREDFERLTPLYQRVRRSDHNKDRDPRGAEARRPGGMREVPQRVLAPAGRRALLSGGVRAGDD